MSGYPDRKRVPSKRPGEDIRKRSMEEARRKRPQGPSRQRQDAAGPDPAEETRLEGRQSVREAYRAGRTIDKLYVQEGITDTAIETILRYAKEAGTIVTFLSREKLDSMSFTGQHQGVIAQAAAVEYVQPEDLLRIAREKGEDPFFFMLDGIEDPHNLGAIIRTANAVGAHGVIIPKHRAATVTAACARASAGAVNHTPVAKATNLSAVMKEMKKAGVWFACADMDGQPMGKADLTGPLCLVIGSEGDGVSRLVREECDLVVSIPLRGKIESLNASVACGVLAYEALRQRDAKAEGKNGR